MASLNMAERGQILWSLRVAVGFGGGGQTSESYGCYLGFHKLKQLGSEKQSQVTFHCLTIMADWRVAIQDELSQLHQAAVANRETIVPKIAELPLPTAAEDVLEELAVRQSHLAGMVPGLNCTWI